MITSFDVVSWLLIIVHCLCGSHGNVVCGSGTEDRYCGGGTARLIIANLFLLRRTIFLSANHIPHVRHVVRDFSSGSSGRVRGRGPRNMKSMRPPSAAIFFMTYFHRAGGPWPPRPPLDPLLDFRCGAECYERNISPSYSIYRECAFKFEKLKLMSFPEVNDVYFRLYTFT